METIAPTTAERFRRRLLDALAQSIRERGLGGTSIADIVRIARTSRRTFYECFPDKESCFLELIEHSNVAILAQMTAAIDRAAPWPVQVDQAIDSYLDALTRDPALSLTVSRELPTLGARGAAVQHDGIERAAHLVVALCRSVELGEAGVEPLTLEEAVMLVGGIAELTHRARLRGDDPRDAGPAARRVVKAVLAPRGDRAAAPLPPG
jgi:AcrR family transcriptional regulator